MARLGLRASVQPAHLLDDRDLTELCWPDRAERCFAFRWMLDAGVELALGSDAPGLAARPVAGRSPRPCTAVPTSARPGIPSRR